MDLAFIDQYIHHSTWVCKLVNEFRYFLNMVVEQIHHVRLMAVCNWLTQIQRA